MNAIRRKVALVWAVPILSGIVFAIGGTWPPTSDSQPAVTEAGSRLVQKWAKVSVDLPTSQSLFPPGTGADIANGQCLMCHSAEMVLLQPSLTQDEWVGEIDKMRSAFGAPVPAEQVDALASYLYSISAQVRG